MAVEVELETISSGYNLTKINTNFQRIDAALQDAVSRSGTAPNQMDADLDLNSHDLLNVGLLEAVDITVNGVPIDEVVGIQGETGPQGPAGTNGTNGADGADGVVQSIVAGSNVTVDATDPANPIISAAAGYTNEEAQDAVGTILTDTATIDFVYTDSTPLIEASVKDASITTAKMTSVATTRTVLKALDTTVNTVAWLKEAGREGMFIWKTGDYSTQITADTQEGIYLKADAIASTAGAWVRVYIGQANVKWFGAVGDGTTDDSTPIQKAIDLVRDIWFPQATYAIGTRITIGNGTSSAISTTNGYNIRGSTAGTTATETAPVILPTTFKWIGATFTAMLRIDGPMVGCNINGLVFDCNDIAGSTGIHTRHMMLSTWQDVVVRNNRSVGIIHESYPTFSGMAQGANKNTFTNVRVVDCGAGGSGMRVGNTAATTSDVLDVAQNVWINCHFERDGTSAPAFSLYLAFTDNITFIETVIMASGGSLGVGVYINEPTGASMQTFPDEVLFLNCPLIDGFVVSGTWVPTSGIICYPYPTGDGEPIPTSDYIRGATFKNKFFNGIILDAGKTTVPPLKFTSGTLETTAEAGAVEYDGKAFYATTVASSRQVLTAKQIATAFSVVSLTNNITTAQSIFAAANDTLTVAAATTYRFRAHLMFNTGATSHTTSFGFGGTATFNSCRYNSRAQSSAADTLATPQNRRVSTASAAVLTAASTAVTTDIVIEGIIRTSAGGTIIPQVTFSAGPTGTCETAIDSFFELEPIGSNSVAAVGNWA
jgi:hypothetical protein